jgi:hypothetical protein
MEGPKIRLTKEKETYLATLYGKALDAERVFDAILCRFMMHATNTI